MSQQPAPELRTECGSRKPQRTCAAALCGNRPRTVANPRPAGWALLGATPALAGCGATEAPVEATDAYVIVGELAEMTDAGEAVLSRATAVLGASEDMARAPIAEGAFRIAGDAAYVGRMTLAVHDQDGERKGSTQFILEPGEIRIRYAGPVAGLTADGGHYNQRLIALWRDTDAYRGNLEDYAAVMEEKGGLAEDDQRREALGKEAVRLYNALNGIRREALREVALADDDPLASLLAIEMGGLGRQEALDRLAAIEERLGVRKNLPDTRKRLKTGMRMAGTRRSLQVGTRVREFAAPDLGGGVRRLSEALAGNSHVLIEFWASWCGPCRAEYPHLKTAYEKYRDKGLEIFAYSLDDNREDWEEASLEDGIPWINTSDLRAYDSSVPQQFGVLAIPMSFLVDGEGEIEAISLRGDALHEKLAELFGAESGA